MTEQKVKKRGWVKNAAIIFLAVMLALTFFSNTIMNHSLPQVATVNVTSGTITAKVRGTGTVEAYETYEVTLSQTRTVESVPVRVGDMVTAGDILFMLSGGESEELEQAISALEELQFQYDKSLISMSDLDYAREDRDIQLAKADLAEAEAERDKNAVSDAVLNQAKDEVSFLAITIESMQQEIADIQQSISNLGSTGGSSAQLATLSRQISETSAEISAAQSALSSANIAYGDDVEQIRAAAQILMREDVELAVLASNYQNSKTHQQWLAYLTAYETDPGFDETDPEWTGFPYPPGITLADFNTYLTQKITTEQETSAWQSKLPVYMDAQATIYSTSGTAEQKSYAAGYSSVKAAEKQIAELNLTLADLRNQYNILLSEDDSAEYTRLNNLLKTKQDTLKFTQTLLKDAQTVLDELTAKKAVWETADAQVKTLQRSLEDMLFALAETKKTDETTQALANLDLQKMRKEIEKQQELVAELQGDTADSAVTAPVSGRITSLSVKAGEKTGTDALATIELTDRGYLLSFSVTLDQAKKVSVGEIAEVSNYYWGAEIRAKLISIKNDPDNPRERKLLSFEITGDVESGSQLSLTLGNKGVQL
jgi:multidrug resistance efflux pump